MVGDKGYRRCDFPSGSGGRCRKKHFTPVWAAMLTEAVRAEFPLLRYDACEMHYMRCRRYGDPRMKKRASPTPWLGSRKRRRGSK